MANLTRNAFAPLLAGLTLLALGGASARSHSPARRPAPRTYELSPRRIEARIDARGHDRILLQATAPPPAFQVTVQFVDPSTNRSMATVRLSTDDKVARTSPVPLPIFRARLWASASRDFRLTLTLQ